MILLLLSQMFATRKRQIFSLPPWEPKATLWRDLFLIISSSNLFTLAQDVNGAKMFNSFSIDAQRQKLPNFKPQTYDEADGNLEVQNEKLIVILYSSFVSEAFLSRSTPWQRPTEDEEIRRQFAQNTDN